MDAKIAVVVMALNLCHQAGCFFPDCRKNAAGAVQQIFGENTDLWGGLFASHRVRYTDHLCDLGRAHWWAYSHDVGHTLFIGGVRLHCS
jgi:hypothetical protein